MTEINFIELYKRAGARVTWEIRVLIELTAPGKTLKNYERCRLVRHTGVFLTGLPPHVQRNILLRTPQQSQSIKQTHPDIHCAISARPGNYD